MQEQISQKGRWMGVVGFIGVLALMGAGCVSPDGGSGSSSGDMQSYRDQGLTSLPQDVLEKTGVEELDLSRNNLMGALPAEIRHLQELRVLDISDNQFTGVPAEVGQLSKLEVLDLSNNQLTGLPHELGDLQNLRLLDVSGNDISEFDLNIIKESLPEGVEVKE